MIEKIYSKIFPGNLLHQVIRFNAIPEGRIDTCAPNEFLQVATLSLPEGKTFQAHRHRIKSVDILSLTQESWIVLRGKVRAIYYDMNSTDILEQKILKEGDTSITFRGGHNYEVLEDAIVIEFKSGPYVGREFDKENIE